MDDRCDKGLPNFKGVRTRCVLTNGHQASERPEYAVCCADTATLIHRIRDGKYLDKTAAP